MLTVRNTTLSEKARHAVTDSQHSGQTRLEQDEDHERDKCPATRGTREKRVGVTGVTQMQLFVNGHD